MIYARPGKDEWYRDEVHGNGEIPIAALDSGLTLAQIYDDVTLPPLAVGEGEEFDEEG